MKTPLIILLGVLSTVFALDDLDLKLARNVYGQEREYRLAYSRPEPPVSNDTKLFIELMYEPLAIRNKREMKTVDMERVVEDFKAVHAGIDQSYPFNPSMGYSIAHTEPTYRDESPENMKYALFYLLLQDLINYKNYYDPDFEIPDLNVDKSWAGGYLKMYNWNNSRTHYYHEDMPEDNSVKRDVLERIMGKPLYDEYKSVKFVRSECMGDGRLVSTTVKMVRIKRQLDAKTRELKSQLVLTQRGNKDSEVCREIRSELSAVKEASGSLTKGIGQNVKKISDRGIKLSEKQSKLLEPYRVVAH